MNDADRNRIIEAVIADGADMVAFCEDLVAIPTENPPGSRYGDCVEVITDKLRSLEIDHEIVMVPVDEMSPSAGYPRYAILARHGESDPLLHFHGHYDVVPSDNEDQFQPTVKDGMLYGRGSSDMKSGLVTMIYALKALKTCSVELCGSVGLAIVPEEETGGVLGSKYLADAGLIGKGGLGMLTAEPTSGAIWSASRGAISLLVRVKGLPIHVGLQYEGVNAFDNMVVVANALTKLKHEVEERSTAFNIEPDAARRSILMLGGRCEGGTNFNLVPGECSFTVDRRINPEERLSVEKERLLEVLNEVRDSGIDLEIELLQEGESAGVSENNPVARALTGNVRRITGSSPRFEMCPGLLEIRFYAANGIPAFAYGPGILSVSHGPAEYVPIKNIVDCAGIYALTAREVLAA